MSTNVSPSPSRLLGGSGVKWGWLLALGLLMLVLGVIGLGRTYQLTVAAMFWLGVLVIVAGVAQILDAFHHKEWKGIIWHVIIGLVYLIAGVVMITTPLSSAFWLTMFLAFMLIINGISRVIMAFQIRGHGSVWFWVLLSGVISVALGVFIYGNVVPPSGDALATPEGQAAWIAGWGGFIGLFVAVELIMEGIALVSIALAVKSAQKIG